MAVTETDIRLIRESFERLRADLDTHSVYFYEALFRHAPDLRPMFRDDLAGQGMKFMTTLGVIVGKLDDEEAAEEYTASLAKKHALLGVRAADFGPMGDALVDTLRHALGDDFDTTIEQAWRNAFAAVSARMIRLGRMGDP